MKNINFYKKSLFFLFSLAVLVACGGGGSDSGGGSEGDGDSDGGQPTPAPQARVISNIGDSISTGFGRATPWPSRLSSLLGEPISNNAKDGEQTSYGLSIIEDVIRRDGTTHLTIMLGTNDASRGSVPVAIANLQSMIDIANSRGVKVFVATLPPVTNNPSRHTNTGKISDGIRRLSGATIVDVRTAMGSGAGVLADGVHPNDRGQQIIADAFANALR